MTVTGLVILIFLGDTDNNIIGFLVAVHVFILVDKEDPHVVAISILFVAEDSLEGVKVLSVDEGEVVLDAGSGRYEFVGRVAQ